MGQTDWFDGIAPATSVNSSKTMMQWIGFKFD
jgi:hypothetical protein